MTFKTGMPFGIEVLSNLIKFQNAHNISLTKFRYAPAYLSIGSYAVVVNADCRMV